jgi:hypothetical protein
VRQLLTTSYVTTSFPLLFHTCPTFGGLTPTFIPLTFILPVSVIQLRAQNSRSRLTAQQACGRKYPLALSSVDSGKHRPS